MHHMHSIPISGLNWEHFRDRFMSAVNRRVGKKPGQITDLDAAKVLGCHFKTVQGYQYVGQEPGMLMGRKLSLVFGPGFINEIFPPTDQIEALADPGAVLSLADVRAMRDSMARAIEAIDAVLKPESNNITKLERAG